MIETTAAEQTAATVSNAPSGDAGRAEPVKTNADKGRRSKPVKTAPDASKDVTGSYSRDASTSANQSKAKVGKGDTSPETVRDGRNRPAMTRQTAGGVTEPADRKAPAMAARNEVLREKLERAAMPCPEEYRAAYVRLLGELFADNDDVFTECDVVDDKARAGVSFELAILRIVAGTPELDPWDMAEVADTVAPVFPPCKYLAEDLRMLSRLRHREHR